MFEHLPRQVGVVAGVEAPQTLGVRLIFLDCHHRMRSLAEDQGFLMPSTSSLRFTLTHISLTGFLPMVGRGQVWEALGVGIALLVEEG